MATVTRARRLLVGLVVLVVLAAWPARPAHAQDEENAFGPLDALYAVEELGTADRELLRSIAEKTGLERALVLLKASLVGGKGASPIDPDAMLARAVHQLVSRGGWRASLLRDAVDGVAPSLSPPSGRSDADALVANVVKGLAGGPTGPCAALHRGFLQALDAHAKGIEPQAPLSYARISAQPAPCVGPNDPAASKILRQYVFVTVFGVEGDEVWAFSGGARPEVRPVTHAFGLQDRRVFVAAVPRNVPVTFSTFGRGVEVPVHRSFVSTIDRFVWGTPPKLVCLDLAMRLAPNDVVLVDGRPTPLGAVYVTDDEEHDVSVLRRGPLEPTLIATRVVKSNGQVRCEPVRFDLLPHQGGATQLALAKVSASESCVGAGIDASTLRSRTTEFLRRRTKDFRDLEGWASTMQGLQSFLGVLESSGTGLIGADRGRLESAASLRSAAAELTRQGFAGLVSLEAHCSRRFSGGWDYSFLARLIELTKIETRPRDEIEGIDLDKVLRTEIETVFDDSQLRFGLEAPLNRLLGLSYVRFLDDGASRALHEIPVFALEIFVASGSSNTNKEKPAAPHKYSATLTSRFLSPAEATSICQPLRDDRQLRTITAVSDALETKEGDDGLVQDKREFSVEGDLRRSTRIDLRFRPNAPGTYLLKVRVLRPESSPAETSPIPIAYSCVEIEDTKTRLWFALGASGQAFAPEREARAENLTYLSLMGGIEWRMASSLWVGLGTGYAYARRRRFAPPSWADVQPARYAVANASAAAPNYDPSGQLSLVWVRHSVLFGPSFTFADDPFPLLCTKHSTCAPLPRRLGLVARIMPVVLDFGFIDPTDVPTGLATFISNRSFYLDLSAIGQAGISVRLSRSQALLLLFTMGYQGYDFHIGPSAAQRRALQRIEFDPGLLLGASIGWSLDL